MKFLVWMSYFSQWGLKQTKLSNFLKKKKKKKKIRVKTITMQIFCKKTIIFIVSSVKHVNKSVR